MFLVLPGLAILAALVCVKRIPEGQAYTLRRLGGHMRTIGAGTHLVVPLVERVTHRIRLLGNVVKLEHLDSGAGDREFEGRIYYQVLDAERADAVIDRVDVLVRGCLSRRLADVQDADDMARDQRIKVALNSELRERGILITRVQLRAA
jgi:regulator of protease activity HflC (stomatin/prohibitin superfamily)